MIYLDNAARTLEKPESVLQGSPGQGADKDAVKALAAQLFHLESADSVFLTGSGQAAMERAITKFIPAGCHIIATITEAGDTLNQLETLKEQGCSVTCIGTDPYGTLNYDEFEAAVRPQTKAVVCAHGSAVSGNVADLDRICTFARRHGLLVISDGRQTAGGVEVNLESLGVDIYFFTGEKLLMGPETIGGICLKASLAKSAGDALKASLEEEIDEESLSSFASALRFISDRGIYGVTMLAHRLEKRFFESVKGMDQVTVYGSFATGDRLPIVSIKAEGRSAEEIRDYMAQRGIVIGVEKGYARFSFGYFNTRPQVKETVWALMDFLGIDDLYLLP